MVDPQEPVDEPVRLEPQDLSQFSRQHAGLHKPQQPKTPRTQRRPVPSVELVREWATLVVFQQLTVALGFVLGVGRREATQVHGPAEGKCGLEVADALFLRHGPVHDLVRSLTVVDQDKQDVAVGPLWDLLTASTFKVPMDTVYFLYRLSGAVRDAEEHPLGEPHSLEEPLDRSVGKPPREEQPVHSLDRRELGCPTSEEQQDSVRAAPDAPCDRRRQGWMVHALPFDGWRQR